jgi:hypothetical protein
VTLEVSGLRQAILSCVQLTGDPLVARIADVTQSCSNGPDDRGVLIVRLCEMPPEATPEFLAKVVDHPRMRKLPVSDVQVTRHSTFLNQAVEARPSVPQALAAPGRDDVAVLPPRGDPCWTILRNRARWRRIGTARGKTTTAHPASVVEPPSLVEPPTHATVSR